MKYLFLAILFFGFLCWSCKEKANDAVVRLNEEAWSLKNINKDSTLALAYSALTYSTKSNNKKEKARALTTIGAIHYEKNLYDSCNFYVQQANKIYTDIDNKEGIIFTRLLRARVDIRKGGLVEAKKELAELLEMAKNNNLLQQQVNIYSSYGVIYKHEGKLDSAILCSFEDMKISDKLDNMDSKVNTLLKVAFDYFVSKNLEKSEIYFRQAKELAEKNGFENFKATAYQGLGIVEHERENYDKAIALYDSTYFIYVKLKEPMRQAIALGNKARSLGQQDKFEEAIIIMQKAKIIFEEIQEVCFCVKTDISIAELYVSNKEVDKAMNKINELQLNENIVNCREEYNYYYYVLSNIYEKSNDYKTALSYSRRNNKIADSIMNISKLKNIQELQVKFETEKKELENKLLQTENEQKAKQNQYLILGAFVLFVIIVLIAFLYHKLNKTKNEKAKLVDDLKHSNDKLEENQKLLEFRNKLITDAKEQAEKERNNAKISQKEAEKERTIAEVATKEAQNQKQITEVTNTQLQESLKISEEQKTEIEGLKSGLEHQLRNSLITIHKAAHFSLEDLATEEGKKSFIEAQIKLNSLGYGYHLILSENSGDINTKTLIYLCESVCAAYKMENIDIETTTNVRYNKFTNTQRLYITILELIRNAVKHAFPSHIHNPKITLSIQEDENYFIWIDYQDNGIGKPTQIRENAEGMKSFEDSAVENTFVWENNKEGGTHIKFCLKKSVLDITQTV